MNVENPHWPSSNGPLNGLKLFVKKETVILRTIFFCPALITFFPESVDSVLGSCHQCRLSLTLFHFDFLILAAPNDKLRKMKNMKKIWKIPNYHLCYFSQTYFSVFQNNLVFFLNNLMVFHSPPIKSVIDRDDATCQNNNHFERPTILNAPWDEHCMMF